MSVFGCAKSQGSGVLNDGTAGIELFHLGALYKIACNADNIAVA